MSTKYNKMSKQFETPILFLIFNRPDTTQQVFNQIKQIKPKYLFVAADGPRLEKVSDFEKCNETRNIIKQIDWDCDLKTLFRENNLGCGMALSTAITWFFSNVDEGIILEDDCLPDLSFFTYCEELLSKYSDAENIMHINGSNFQNGIVRGTGSYYFSNYHHIWGWATWKRAWSKYDYEMKDFYLTFNFGRLDHVFQNKNEKKYWNNIFIKTCAMQTNTWDYQWTYAIWKNKGSAITPNFNLVVNLGLNDNSSHIFLNDSLKNNRSLDIMPFPLKHPSFTIDNEADKFTFINIFSHTVNRLIRLFSENGFIRIRNYLIKRYSK